jgi:ethanolamine utilization protein EutQ (cupin superfamily)
MDNLSKIIKKVLKEEHDGSSRYMFFSNLEQMRRQCDLLLDLDESMVEKILDNGHDWAQDHISESKNNMDQVFDFLMNETKKDGMELSMDIDDKDMVKEGEKKVGTKLCSRGIASAKAKYDVYPSAYANGHAVQVCTGKIKGLDGKRHCSGAYC